MARGSNTTPKQSRKTAKRSTSDDAPQSFRLLRRRDIKKRPLNVGYLAFTKDILVFLWQERRLLGLAALLHFVVMMLLIGVMSQSDYRALGELIGEVSREAFGASSGLAAGTVLFLAAISGSISDGANDVQQIFVSFVNLLTWLVIVWLLRQRLLGAAVKLRDGLYNAAAPLIPTLIIIVVALLQLAPVSLGIIMFASLSDSGFLSGGIESAMFAVAVGLLGVLGLYWLAATIMAAVIVTLPGTYPLVSLRQARVVVSGRRLAIILRLLWLGLLVLGLWLLVLVPVMLLDAVIASPWLPLVPLAVQLLSTVGVIFISTYIYLLYRKVIDDDATA